MCNENIWCWGNVYKNQLWNINVKHETLLQWGKVICSQQGGASLYKSIYVTRDKVAAEPASHWSILGLPRSDWLTQMVAYITLHKRAVASGGAQTSHIGRGAFGRVDFAPPHNCIVLLGSAAGCVRRLESASCNQGDQFFRWRLLWGWWPETSEAEAGYEEYSDGSRANFHFLLPTKTCSPCVLVYLVSGTPVRPFIGIHIVHLVNESRLWASGGYEKYSDGSRAVWCMTFTFCCHLNLCGQKYTHCWWHILAVSRALIRKNGFSARANFHFYQKLRFAKQIYTILFLSHRVPRVE